jgi:hypothetical protein
MMRDMGWKGGALGKQNNGIATAITGKSIGWWSDRQIRHREPTAIRFTNKCNKEK